MNTIAAFFVILGVVSSLIIALDVARHRQSMSIMNSVWILTGLWAGVLALVAYFWFGRQNALIMRMNDDKSKMDMSKMDMGSSMSMKMPEMSMPKPNMQEKNMSSMMRQKRPYWQSVTLSTLHCGAGCTLADLIGEWFLYFVAISIGGSLIAGGMVFDYVLALIIGVYFQYAAIRSMSTSMTRGQTLAHAFKADVLSLTAWQIGMYGVMLVALFIVFPNGALHRVSWMYWFVMQIAMIVGFIFALPTNVILIKLGIKKAM